MTGIGFLRVTRLLTMVNTTIEGTVTGVSAREHASPLLNNVLTIFSKVLFVACNFVATVSTQESFLDLTTVTTSIHTFFTSSTETLVAGSRTLVFSAGHEITTDLTTAPAVFIVSVGTAASRLVLAAETSLSGTHMGTRRARASMTSQLTRMRAFANSFPATSVPARMRRQTSDWAWLNFFLAPACICLGQSIFRKVASRASPLSRRRNLAVLSTLLLSSGRSLILRPLPDTGHVENSPASMA